MDHATRVATSSEDGASAGAKADQESSQLRPKPEAAPASGSAGAPQPPIPAHKLGAIYTMVAREGMDAAALVNRAMAKKPIGRNPPRHLQIAPPGGPSTEGGRLARQPVRLVENDSGVGALMCGYIDVARRVADIRDYRMVAKQHQERFGTRFEPTVQEYDGLIHDLEVMLRALSFTIVRESADAGVEWEPQGELPELTRGGLLWLGAAGLALALLLGLLWW